MRLGHRDNPLNRTRRTDSGCLEWTGPLYRYGYGKTMWGRQRTVTAHRKSWIMNVGEIPPGLYVLHKCDNPPCINPEHLFLGTQKDNIRDRDLKGRRRVKRKEYSNERN